MILTKQTDPYSNKTDTPYVPVPLPTALDQAIHGLAPATIECISPPPSTTEAGSFSRSVSPSPSSSTSAPETVSALAHVKENLPRIYTILAVVCFILMFIAGPWMALPFIVFTICSAEAHKKAHDNQKPNLTDEITKRIDQETETSSRRTSFETPAANKYDRLADQLQKFAQNETVQLQLEKEFFTWSHLPKNLQQQLISIKRDVAALPEKIRNEFISQYPKLFIGASFCQNSALRKPIPPQVTRHKPILITSECPLPIRVTDRHPLSRFPLTTKARLSRDAYDELVTDINNFSQDPKVQVQLNKTLFLLSYLPRDLRKQFYSLKRRVSTLSPDLQETIRTLFPKLLEVDQKLQHNLPRHKKPSKK